MLRTICSLILLSMALKGSLGYIPGRKIISSHQQVTQKHRVSCQREKYAELPEITNQKNITDLSLAFSQLRPFLNIATPFFKEDKVARNSLIGVVAMTLLNSGVSVAFSYVSRDFYNALNARDEAMFYEKIALFFSALVVAVPVSVYYRYLREKLALYWREALTARVLDKYYSNRTFFVMETLQNVDNPDQRISDDIRAFTRTSLDFLITILTSIIDLFSFSAILFQIYPGLFIAIIAYAGVGSVVTTNLGRTLVGLNYDKLQREANFRFALIRTRENAEAIAFYDREARLERQGLWTLFKEVLDNQLGIVTTQRNLEYFTTSYRYLVQVLPSLIVAPLYFAKKIELGSISQSYGAFNHILGDFSLIINSFEALSAFSAGLTRLSTFLALIEEGGWNMTALSSSSSSSSSEQYMDFAAAAVEARSSRISLRRVPFSVAAAKVTAAHRCTPCTDVDSAPLLTCTDLTVRTPDGSRVLIGGVDDSDQHQSFYNTRGADAGLGTGVESGRRGVNLSVSRGSRLLVVGASGAGKSSFIRAIAGLWELGSGSVFWTCADSDVESERGRGGGPPPGVFFLPQKPYNFLGTLREQIQYPSCSVGPGSGSVSPLSASPQSSYSTGLESEVSGRSSGSEDAADAHFLQILRRVRLDGLAERVGGLDAHWDWSNVLSLGEQQRLAFARVLYNTPSLVVLDEATSALDLATEEAMYQLLRDSGASYVSVGHRPSLLRYHDSKLVLSGPGVDICVVPICGPGDDSDALVDLTDVNVSVRLSQ